MDKKITSGDAILEAVGAFPKSTAAELAAILDATNDVVKSGLRRLENKGQLIRGTRETDTASFIVYTVNPDYQPAPRKKRKSRVIASVAAKPVKASPKLTIGESQSELQIEVEELREWKRRALIACPELNVDPLVYKAREIFARHTDDKKLKDDIYSGKLDKRPPMLALIEVLENGA